MSLKDINLKKEKFPHQCWSRWPQSPAPWTDPTSPGCNLRWGHSAGFSSAHKASPTWSFSGCQAWRSVSGSEMQFRRGWKNKGAETFHTASAQTQLRGPRHRGGECLRTHVISVEPDRLWSLDIIFSAAAFFAVFLELPVAGGTSHGQRQRSGTKAAAWAAASNWPVSVRSSRWHRTVNSLMCGGPASVKTTYSGRRQPLCNANSWRRTSPQTQQQGLVIVLQTVVCWLQFWWEK